MRLVVVMMALRTMDVRRLLGGRGELSGQHNPAGFLLLGQVFRDFRMERFDIADHAVQEAA